MFRLCVLTSQQYISSRQPGLSSVVAHATYGLFLCRLRSQVHCLLAEVCACCCDVLCACREIWASTFEKHMCSTQQMDLHWMCLWLTAGAMRWAEGQRRQQQAAAEQHQQQLGTFRSCRAVITLWAAQQQMWCIFCLQQMQRLCANRMACWSHLLCRHGS